MWFYVSAHRVLEEEACFSHWSTSGYAKQIFPLKARINKIVNLHVLLSNFLSKAEIAYSKSPSSKATSVVPPSFLLSFFCIFPFISPASLNRSCPFESLASQAFVSLSLSFQFDARTRDVSALIGLPVRRLRSCGINSPARFTSLWLYARCRNRARTGILLAVRPIQHSRNAERLTAPTAGGERARCTSPVI